MGVNNMGKQSQMWLQMSAYRQNLDFWFSDGPSMATGAKYGFQFRKWKWIIPFRGLLCRTPVWMCVCSFLRTVPLVSKVYCLLVYTLPTFHTHHFLVRCPPAGPTVVQWTGFNYIPSRAAKIRDHTAGITLQCVLLGSENLLSVWFFKRNPLKRSLLSTSVQFSSWKLLSWITTSILWDL